MINKECQLAKQAHQALGQHRQQARGEQKRLDTHILEAGDGTDGGVGVQGGKYQVSGEGGLHGDLPGLEISYLTDHHHVRVLAQDRPQAPREGHIHLGVDLGLTDARQHVLDGILDREDIA